MNHKGIWVGVIILAVLVAAGILIYQNNQKTAQRQAEAAADASFGSDLYESTQNPVKDKLPETNPFESAKTNPFAE